MGHPLFQGGKEEQKSSRHGALWLRADEHGPLLVALSGIPHRSCVPVHIIVADVFLECLATVAGCRGLCFSGWPMVGQEVAWSDHLYPIQARRHKSILQIFLCLAIVVRVFPGHGSRYTVRYHERNPFNPITEVNRAGIRSGKAIVPL